MLFCPRSLIYRSGLSTQVAKGLGEPQGQYQYISDKRFSQKCRDPIYRVRDLSKDIPNNTIYSYMKAVQKEEYEK